MEKLWKGALSKGVCPFAGCEIRTRTCYHLDRYLQYGPDTYTDYDSKDVKKNKKKLEVKTYLTDEVDKFGVAESSQQPHPVWSLFKKLRKFGLNRDQIGILLRRHGVGMTDRQILESMHWTSFDSLYQRERKALQLLRKHGFKGEVK